MPNLKTRVERLEATVTTYEEPYPDAAMPLGKAIDSIAGLIAGSDLDLSGDPVELVGKMIRPESALCQEARRLRKPSLEWSLV